MTNWLKLTDEQRKATIDQAEQLSGIPGKIIEKDWWVTLTLKALFQTFYGKYMIFKGGTSLSKCWKLIERFSEDIDIALSPEAFGMEYVNTPTKGHVERLKKAGCQFTSTILKSAINEEMKKLYVPKGLVEVFEQPIPENFPDTDPQIIFIKYPTVTEPNEYIKDEVKIEVTVRSQKMPYTSKPIISLLYEYNPNHAYAEEPFTVEVVEPRKTFIEKLMLLHEEFRKPDRTRIRTERMSRHFSDLSNMASKNIDAEAFTDHTLYDHLQEHRKSYYRIPWIDYDLLKHDTLSFLPPAELWENYRADYKSMQQQMIYGDSVSFDELMQQAKWIQGKLRMKYEHKTLEEIVSIANEQLEEQRKSNGKNGLYTTIVSFASDPDFPKSLANKSVLYTVALQLYNGNFYFEKVEVSKP